MTTASDDVWWITGQVPGRGEVTILVKCNGALEAVELGRKQLAGMDARAYITAIDRFDSRVLRLYADGND